MNKESVREVGTCLGGFLGMFLGAFLGFAVCTKIAFDKIARNDGSVDPNQALLPLVGVVVGGGVGAVAGAVLVGLLITVIVAILRVTRDETSEAPRGGRDSSI